MSKNKKEKTIPAEINQVEPIIQEKSQEEKSQPTICLTMIVKNESQVIRRCIDSVKDYISYWVIVDTGSTDGTQDLIKEIMEEYGIPGELHERPWVDFGHNRTESLNYSKDKADYRLIIDADDVLFIENPEVNPFLNISKDFYKIKIRLGSLAYYRTQLVRGDQNWKYVGVLHEYLSGPEDMQLEEDFLDGIEMHASVSGHNRDIKGKDKYYNDALIFEKAILTTPKEDLPIDLERRYVFYMAQSYRDAGMHQRSIEAYQRRIDLGGWNEEIYISKYWIARQKQTMESPDQEIIDAYLKAWEYRPNRLEALYHLIKFLGSRKRYALAFALSSVGMKTGPCSDILFVEDDIWKWRMPDEYSVLAYYNGNAEEAHKTTTILINSPVFGKIPKNEQDRIHKNIEFYNKAIGRESVEEEKEELQES
jgi:glycosyltransferase involved in cell wall biosynthesis